MREGARTSPELELIVDSLSCGATLIEYEHKLEIVARTVDFHRSNVMRKLGAGKIAELVGKILTKWRPRAIVPVMPPAGAC